MKYYCLRPILFFANTDISTIKMCLDTSILAKRVTDWRSIKFKILPAFDNHCTRGSCKQKSGASTVPVCMYRALYEYGNGSSSRQLASRSSRRCSHTKAATSTVLLHYPVSKHGSLICFDQITHAKKHTKAVVRPPNPQKKKIKSKDQIILPPITPCAQLNYPMEKDALARLPDNAAHHIPAKKYKKYISNHIS
jgi:hypothetical protein